MYNTNYYSIYDKKEDDLEFILKIIINYESINRRIKFSNNIKLTLSEIYYEYLPDIIKYETITKVKPSDFLWVNDYVNNIPNQMIIYFCSLILKVLMVKYSVEKLMKTWISFNKII